MQTDAGAVDGLAPVRVIVKLRVVPVFLSEANDFVRRFHRHHKPVPGALFSVGVCGEDGLHGVAIASRPIARGFDDGISAEITRCCTDGTFNACSMLYAALRKALWALGYRRIITYTLPGEGGASLRAAGFKLDALTDGGDWFRPERRSKHTPDDLIGGKWRWIA